MEQTASLHDPVIQTLTDHLGPPVLASGGEVRFDSPFTSGKPDRKKHLYVNPRKGKFFCFKSNISGSLSYLFCLLGAEHLSSDPPIQPLEDMKKRLALIGHRPSFSTPMAELPEWYKPVQKGSTVHSYLLGRGLTNEDIEFYRIGEGFGEFAGWLIIPSFGPYGKCEYWVARNTVRKMYKNPQVDRRYHVGFLYTALQFSPKSVVVCEGMFSAIVAGRDATAAFGKYVTTHQLNKLRQVGVERVTLALDGDAWSETLTTAERCITMGFETYIVPLPRDQDPADLGRGMFLEMKERAVLVDKLSIMKFRLDGVT